MNEVKTKKLSYKHSALKFNGFHSKFKAPHLPELCSLSVIACICDGDTSKHHLTFELSMKDTHKGNVVVGIQCSAFLLALRSKSWATSHFSCGKLLALFSGSCKER